MPPTQNAVFQHCLRAVFQGSVWATSHDPEIEEPDPCLYGWTKASDGAYRPVWMTVREVSHVCRELIKCSCRKSCSLMCSTCVKKNLTCTNLCKCAYVEKSSFPDVPWFILFIWYYCLSVSFPTKCRRKYRNVCYVLHVATYEINVILYYHNNFFWVYANEHIM